MATHDYVIANASGAAVRADLNNALAAIVTNNSNAVEPATTYAFQWWADTTAGQLKLRNAANDGWVVIQELDGTMLMENGSAASPGLAFANDLDTGIFRPDADALAIATNGVERVEFGTSEVVFNDGGEDIDFRVEGNNNAQLLVVDASINRVKIGSELRVVSFIAHDGDANTKFGFPDNDTITFQTDNIERLRINSSGQILVGTSSTSATAVAVFQGASGDPCNIYLQRPTTTPADGNSLGQIFFSDSGGGPGARISAQRDGGTWTSGSSHPGALVFSSTGDGASSPSEKMRIASDGLVTIGTANPTTSSNLFVRSEDNYVAVFDRRSTDGTIVQLRQNNITEGTISVSGSTVSYNGAHLSRWSQILDIDPYDKTARPEILRGTVMSNLDEMCDWTCPTTGDCQNNEQLNKTKISDVEGDKNVAGVFQSWDDDDDTWTNDYYLAMTGDFVIRIAAGTTVQRGNLLMSAGDGTAKPQDDDIIRSKTIAKITSTNVSCTHPDGSYCVPCVLMAC